MRAGRDAGSPDAPGLRFAAGVSDACPPPMKFRLPFVPYGLVSPRPKVRRNAAREAPAGAAGSEKVPGLFRRRGPERLSADLAVGMFAQKPLP